MLGKGEAFVIIGLAETAQTFRGVVFSESAGEFEGVGPFSLGGEPTALAGALFFETGDFFVGFERAIFTGESEVAGRLHGGLPDVVTGAAERERQGPARGGEFAVGAQFELHAALRPARAVGGDLYSYFMLDPQRFFVMVGDVSDKGIPAALFMAQTITLAKALAPRAQTPPNLLRLLNLELCRGNDSCMFVTLLCGLLDTGSGDLVLASAGHEPPILCGRDAPQLLEFPTGAVLGLYEDSTYPEQRLRLRPGATLLMYTDGITEASDHELQMYGIERTVESLAQVPSTADTAAYIERLLGDVDHFVADAAQADDITLLALTWHGTGVPATGIDIDNRLPDVFVALDRCEQLLQEAKVPASLHGDVRLVLEELMVNTVEYGYPDGRPGRIRLLLQSRPGATTIELIDDGIAFDPLQSATPDLTGDLADRAQIGGLGIHLARSMTSEMRYTRDAHGNHLLLRFAYPNLDGSPP